MKAIQNTTYEISTAENIAIRKVNRMMSQIINDLDDNGANGLASCITGEIVHEEELERVKGILTALLDHAVWQYQFAHEEDDASDCDDVPEDDNECGYDPYMGCISFDC